MHPIDFHRRLPGYEPTRLVALPAPRGARRMLVKLETERFGLPAFKVLGASWSSAHRVAAWLGRDLANVLGLAEFRDLLRARSTNPTLVAATDGNHGRAVAWSGRQMGIDAEIFVPQGTAEARRAAIAGEGANVTIVDGDYDATVAAAAARATGDRLLVQDTLVDGQPPTVDDIVDGYSTIFDEIDEAVGAMPDAAAVGSPPRVLVVPVGVGSLALTAARRLRPGDRLVTVEPVEAASLRRSLTEGRPVSLPGPHSSCMVGLRCGTISPSAWSTLRTAVTEAVALEDAEADEAMREMASAGLVVGECGAAALAAVRQLERSGRLAALLPDPRSEIILVATEAPTDPDRWTRVVGSPPASATADPGS